MTTTAKKTNWADDDSSVGGSSTGPEIVGFSGDSSSTGGSSVFSGIPKFRVSYIKHPSTYSRVLYDVDGHVLCDVEGNPINIFKPVMKDMLSQGHVICYHVPGRPGYRYFVHRKKQADDFRKAKKRGMTASTTPYHVYPDEPRSVLPNEEGVQTAY